MLWLYSKKIWQCTYQTDALSYGSDSLEKLLILHHISHILFSVEAYTSFYNLKHVVNVGLLWDTS